MDARAHNRQNRGVGIANAYKICDNCHNTIKGVLGMYILNRPFIKNRAKSILGGSNYWTLVGVCVIVGLLAGLGSIFTVRLNSFNGDDIRYGVYAFRSGAAYSMRYALLSLVLTLVGCAYTFLVANVLTLGRASAMLKLYRGIFTSVDEVFVGFKGGRYGKSVGTMALTTLFTALGLICFIIPGIIVAYGLSMAPYILLENPNMKPMDVISRSWQITKGHKGDLFVVSLSFIGWNLLTAMTFGILGIFYVTPYIALTDAGCYDALTGGNQPNANQNYWQPPQQDRPFGM